MPKKAKISFFSETNRRPRFKRARDWSTPSSKGHHLSQSDHLIGSRDARSANRKTFGLSNVRAEVTVQKYAAGNCFCPFAAKAGRLVCPPHPLPPEPSWPRHTLMRHCFLIRITVEAELPPPAPSLSPSAVAFFQGSFKTSLLAFFQSEANF